MSTGSIHTPSPSARGNPPGASPKRRSAADALFRGTSTAFAVLVLVILGAILVVLLFQSSEAFLRFGPSFLWSRDWDPVRDLYGALPSAYGTVVSSLIAILIAGPVGIGVAVFLTEMAPPWLSRPVGLGIELLAAIPSIIYGMWGLFVLAPWLNRVLYAHLQEHFGFMPLFKGPSLGISMLTGGLILAVMILPFIASVTRDVFRLIPPMLKESAYGLGSTTWEVIRNVVIPYGRSGIVGAIFLGLGRALGETMAVTFVIGNSHVISASLLSPSNTISSTLANEFAEATTPLHVSSLVALGLILFLITTLILSLAKFLLWRMEKALPGGSKR
ncbi:MAG: phosphate ABC transporter permease subunit PstC [Acidobacteriota bacterium]